MKIEVHNSCADYNSYRAARVKSLFNPERGNEFTLNDTLPLEGEEWQIGLIVGPSGCGKTSIGRMIFGQDRIHDLYAGWAEDKPIVDSIAPDGDFDAVTAALAAVGLGDVPAWLRPFKALSNGQQFRAGLARLMAEAPSDVVVDEFTSVVDRQIAQIGAAAFGKAWRRTGKRIILLACHYDIIEWLQPDWVYDPSKKDFKKKTKSDSGQEFSSIFSRSTTVTGHFLNRITI